MSNMAKVEEDMNPPSSAKLEAVTTNSELKIDTEAEVDLLAVETIPEQALESVKRELNAEIAELEWEFKQIKEALFAERIAQVDRKLQQLRASEAPELLKVSELVDETYSIRKQVAKHRRDFELEVANKEFDNALQMATYDAEENLRNIGERIRLRIQESICILQVERAMAKRTRRTHAKTATATTSGPLRDEPLRQQNAGLSNPHPSHHRDYRLTSSSTLVPSAEVAALLVPGLDDDEEEKRTAKGVAADGEIKGKAEDLTEVVVLDPNYLPGVDLEPRRKPVTLSPSFPRLVYELDEEDVRADIEVITNAIKEQKINMAMSYLKSKERES